MTLPTRPTRYVIFERDEHGSPYAVEVVETDRWLDSFLDPPPPEEADARIVRLHGGTPPPELPRWLAVEANVEATVGDTGRRAAEAPATYSVSVSDSDSAATRQAAGRAQWAWSPYHREPGASLAEFLAAGATAVRYPDPVPAEAERRLRLIAEFATGRELPIGPLARLRSEALERWLRLAFDNPDRLAESLLLARIAEVAPPEVGDALRFFAGAEVPEDVPAHTELAVDRRVLREQASPWRYLDGEPFAAPLAAIEAWRRRYRLAYDAHYRQTVVAAAALRRELDAARPAASALERLDGIRALGPPAGREALAGYAAAGASLSALPPQPDAALPRTGGVTLGREPPSFARARSAATAVRQALEVQRQRLSARAVRLVLERRGVPALDRLLQAIAASEVDAVERVLDQRMAEHIDRLLAGGGEALLERLAARHPDVTVSSIDEAVSTFRDLVEAAIAAAPDGRAVLREDRVAVAG